MQSILGISAFYHDSAATVIIDGKIIAVGDEEFQRKCLNHMEMLRDSGVTIVLVSHDIDQVRDLCDRVAWIDKSHLMEIGDPEKVCEDYLAHVSNSGTPIDQES